jgi:SAM-dependent methyltransferase
MSASKDIGLKNWNSGYLNRRHEKPVHGDWLEKYLPTLMRARGPVLDLGCGAGGNSLLLSDKGCSPVCADFAIEALRSVRLRGGEMPCVLLDMRDGIPFKEETFDFIVADLSLHYFTAETTCRIIDNIYETIAEGGTLLCRVNSMKDTNFGAGAGEEIEHHYYFMDMGKDKGTHKRFFDYDDILNFFKQWHEVACNENETMRRGVVKRVWEIACRKPASTTLDGIEKSLRKS